MAPLFSKADLNKFWYDIQNEVILTCTKFGKDLFSISKVIGRKTKCPRFFGLPCIIFVCFGYIGLQFWLLHSLNCYP